MKFIQEAITVQNALVCVPNLVIRKLELFPRAGFRAFVTIDIMEPPPRTKASNQIVAIMTGRYPKLAKAIPTAKITSTRAANVFFIDWIIFYEIPDTMLSDNGQQSFNKFFTYLCFSLGTTKLRTMAFRPQLNTEIRRCNRTIFSRLQMYNADSQKNCKSFVQPLTSAYHSQVHYSSAGKLF